MSVSKHLHRFPKEFFEILEHFENGGEEKSVLLSPRDAQNIRRRFYRFLAFIKDNAMSGDPQCRELEPVARALTVSVEDSKIIFHRDRSLELFRESFHTSDFKSTAQDPILDLEGLEEFLED